MSDAEEKNASGRAGTGDEYFLGRWSRRKTAHQKGEKVAEVPPAATVADAPPADAALAVESDPRQQLTDADMPSIDSLDSDSDFSVFMSPKVSEQLRTLALRKLFHMPAFNVTDGLNDYDEDYTRFAELGSVVTQEMKRMLRRELDAEDVLEDEAIPVAPQDIPEATADEDIDSVEEPDDESGKA